MDQDAPGEAEQRGDVRYAFLLFVVMTVAGTAIQIALAEETLRRALSTALVIAVPFAAYAWYEGWGF
jgi:hypothetical protein